jgi:hypothetical protein
MFAASLAACSGGADTYPAGSTIPSTNPPPSSPPPSPSPSPSPDTTAPSVSIANPSGATTVTVGTVTVSGTASDNVGVTQVSWQNAATGSSGTASGTTSWSVNIGLNAGANTIAVTARDAAGNASAARSVTVTYNPPAPPAPDTTAPTLGITNPSGNVTVTTAGIGVSGTASDNVGVTQVSWQNAATGASGTASGTTSWSVASIALQSGTNVISVSARDAANNVTTRSVTVTYNAPVAFTAEVVWDPNPDNPSGYTVYVGASTATATNQVATLSQGSGSWDPAAPMVQVPSSTIRPLVGTSSQACFAVKAYNGTGSSAYSPVTCVAMP